MHLVCGMLHVACRIGVRCVFACSHCAAGKLSVRPDRDMYSDLRYAAAVAESSVSCRLPSSAACRLLSVATSAVCCNSVREILFDLIHCYNPVWMRIALEAMYKEALPNHDKASISRFVTKHMVKNPAIVQQHAVGGTKVGTNGRAVFKPSFKAAINNYILCAFVELVALLDKLKRHRLLRSDPCLFGKTAKVKESMAVVAAFAKEIAKAVGDLRRPLAGLGLVFDYKQGVLDEFDFKVTNVLEDLRDGAAPHLRSRALRSPVSRDHARVAACRNVCCAPGMPQASFSSASSKSPLSRATFRCPRGCACRPSRARRRSSM